MASGEDLRTTAAALDGSVVVCGVGRYAETLASARFPGAQPVTIEAALADTADEPSRSNTPNGGSPAAALVAIDPNELSTTRASLRALAETDAFTIAVVPGSDTDRDGVAALVRDADGVLLVGGDGAGQRVDECDTDEAPRPLGVVDAIRTVLVTVREPGFINVDLTDARTVFSAGVAAVGVASAASDAPDAAVGAAFDRLPTAVDAATASAVLTDVVVDPATSITAATDVVGRVRDRVGADANVIWGGAVDESASAELLVRVVVANVEYNPPLVAGDPCPRCGSSLSSYTFGASETLSCDACGYAGIGMRRR